MSTPPTLKVCARKGAQVVLLNRDSIRADEAYGYIKASPQKSWKMLVGGINFQGVFFVGFGV